MRELVYWLICENAVITETKDAEEAKAWKKKGSAFKVEEHLVEIELDKEAKEERFRKIREKRAAAGARKKGA